MRDLAFVGYLGALLLLAMRRPFLFVLVYVYIDIVSPQRISYFLLNSIPLSLIAFGLAVAGFLIDDKRDVRITPRWALLVVLLVYCGYTTSTAALPIPAMEKWSWVWKALVFAIFLPLTLRTKLRIEALALTMVLCSAALTITGGIKTLVTGGGGGYGALVIQIDSNDGLFEGSIISCVAIAIIPLILWLANHGTVFPKDWRVRAFALMLIFACLLIPVGTQARTGLICIAVLAVLLLRYARRRILYAGLMVGVALAVIPLLPASFTQRMETIKGYKADESASTRLAVWGWTWEYVKTHPMGGGFEAYRLNRIRYELPADVKAARELADDPDMPEEQEVLDAGRAFHSSYFEMLGEQGYPGLFLWLLLHIGGIWRMERIQRLYRRRARPGEEWVPPLAVALMNGQIIYLVGSLFVGIAFQPFIYMLIGLQIGLDAYLKRCRSEEEFRPLTQRGMGARLA